jgi:hypothetical protein
MAVFFKEKHVVPLRPIDGAVFKKHVVPLRPIDGAVVPKKHVFPLPTTGVTSIYIKAQGQYISSRPIF